MPNDLLAFGGLNEKAFLKFFNYLFEKNELALNIMMDYEDSFNLSTKNKIKKMMKETKKVSKVPTVQNLYFNKLYYKTIGEANFQMEMDYWGLTYSRGLNYVLDTDKEKKFNVKVDNYGGDMNLLLLPKEDRERITIVKDDSTADYFMGNYRWCRSEYNYSNEVYNVTVDGAKVLTVFKIKP
jgi:hypothetical protein